jgi:hypothetical protein
MRDAAETFTSQSAHEIARDNSRRIPIWLSSGPTRASSLTSARQPNKRSTRRNPNLQARHRTSSNPHPAVPSLLSQRRPACAALSFFFNYQHSLTSRPQTTFQIIRITQTHHNPPFQIAPICQPPKHHLATLLPTFSRTAHRPLSPVVGRERSGCGAALFHPLNRWKRVALPLSSLNDLTAAASEPSSDGLVERASGRVAGLAGHLVDQCYSEARSGRLNKRPVQEASLTTTPVLLALAACASAPPESLLRDAQARRLAGGKWPTRSFRSAPWCGQVTSYA